MIIHLYIPELKEILGLYNQLRPEDTAAYKSVTTGRFHNDTRKTAYLDMSALLPSPEFFLALDIAKSSKTINKLLLLLTNLGHHYLKVAQILTEFPYLKEVDLSKSYPNDVKEMVKILLTSKSISVIKFEYGGVCSHEKKELQHIIDCHNHNLISSQEKQKDDICRHLASPLVASLPDVITMLVGEYWVDPIAEVTIHFEDTPKWD